MIGSTVSHYRIIEKIGAGGMGEVFLAEDTELGRKVALKFLPPHVASDPEVLARFEREARAAAALQHPNVVTIHEIGSHDGRRFIVMEYVDGDLLARRIESKDLTVDQCIDIAIQLASALGDAHGAGIVHRDLKPDNIIVDKRGQPHVLDFGLAISRGAARLTREGSTVGTVHYMSPEQARGEELDARSDIFSLGAIVYEMITGRKAFEGEHDAAILYKIASEEPQPLSRFNNQVTPQLEAAVAAALAKDRETRHQTMSGLAAALKASRGQSAERRRAASRPRLWMAGAAAVIAVSVIGFTLMRGFRGDDSGETAMVTPIRSIAVLPLKNASANADEEYFADGMTDALISDLSRVSALRVVPRAAVMRYKGSTMSLSEIADELDVDAIIDGSVWHEGNRARINVDLIPVYASERLWGETYETELDDILNVQSKIARAVTGQVKVNIAPMESQWLGAARSVDPEAMRAYMKGNYYMNLMSADANEKARESYQRAIMLDPSFAPAYLGMANVTSYSSWETAGDYARKALELDASLAEAHVVLADIAMDYRWDWDTAREEIARARRLQPNLPEALATEGKLLLLAGKVEQGLASYQSALAFSPLSHPISCSMVAKYVHAQHYDKAIDFGTEVDDNFPTCPSEPRQIGEAYMAKGMCAEALPFLERSLSLYQSAGTLAALGCVYARSGKADEANKVLQRLIDDDADSYATARLHAVLGHRDKALVCLEEALAARSPSVLWMGRDSMFANLRDDERFQNLLARVDLPTG